MAASSVSVSFPAAAAPPRPRSSQRGPAGFGAFPARLWASGAISSFLTGSGKGNPGGQLLPRGSRSAHRSGLREHLPGEHLAGSTCHLRLHPKGHPGTAAGRLPPAPVSNHVPPHPRREWRHRTRPPSPEGGLGYKAASTESHESRLLFYAFCPLEAGPDRDLGEPGHGHTAFRTLAGLPALEAGPRCHRDRPRSQLLRDTRARRDPRRPLGPGPGPRPEEPTGVRTRLAAAAGHARPERPTGAQTRPAAAPSSRPGTLPLPPLPAPADDAGDPHAPAQ